MSGRPVGWFWAGLSSEIAWPPASSTISLFRCRARTQTWRYRPTVLDIAQLEAWTGYVLWVCMSMKNSACSDE
jgi:hypothetical protein